MNTYASGPIMKDLLGLALRGNHYNREASKKYFMMMVQILLQEMIKEEAQLKEIHGQLVEN